MLRPTTRWEKYDEYAERTQTRSNPAAMVFSDGVFYDPKDRLFKMWYMGGYSQNTCYAVSHDGINWDKPVLDVVTGTNIVDGQHRDSSHGLARSDGARSAARFKMALWHDNYLLLFDVARTASIGASRPQRPGRRSHDVLLQPVPPESGSSASATKRRAVRAGIGGTARRRDFDRGARWHEDEPVPWVGADVARPARPEYNVPAELYNLDCVAYESLLLGLFTIFRGERSEREKPNDVCVGFSRDGFHWDRPDRARVPAGVRARRRLELGQRAVGGRLLPGRRRQLHFYVSGRRGVPGYDAPGICSTGLATLRRDGFASMDRAASASGVERLEPSPAPAR